MTEAATERGTYVTTDDGVRLYVEDTGSGFPILFIHEFAGDHRSWEPQVRSFSHRYRCITYGARGYPPSEVPSDPAAYSMERAVADAISVLDNLGIEKAHVVGISMGGFTTLHLARLHPDRLASAVVAACGYGSQLDRNEAFRKECKVIADAIGDEGMDQFGARYALGPARVQFENKDPRGHAEFAQQLREHSQEGSILTMLGVQRERPALFAMREELAQIRVPMLVVTGDEDEGCLEPDLMLKRTIPSAGLLVMPKTGHTANLEEPEMFNRHLQDFFSAAEQGRWPLRDPRSLATSTTGMDE